MRKISLMMLAFISVSAFAQKAERQNIRKGNKQYDQEKYTEAEIDYRKSQEVNPNSPQAAFNLGNALYKQQKFEDAMKQYGVAAQNTTDKQVVSESLHNTGNVFMSTQDYAKAVEAYKQALRLNPGDNETRYNLALAQKLLQDQQDQQQQDKDQDKDQQDQNKDQQQDQQDQQKKDQQDQNKDQKDQKDQQNQDQNKDQQDQQQQQQPQSSDKISKEMAEQILNAMNQDEKEVQEKVKKQQMQQQQQKKTDKDW
ncbi:MAG: tetratricopeptide repeat protein [Bacteroidales bacterium]